MSSTLIPGGMRRSRTRPPIGQKNVVTVYKLIAKGTIEEKIVELQEKKKELADQILGGEEMGTASFTREELMEILRV